MPRIAIRHAHRLAYRRRLSLGLRMLGCLVMLAGAIVSAAALAEAAKGPLSREARLMIVFGVVLFLPGTTLFCGERGMLIDRETRSLKRWWSVVLPLRRTFDDISHYQAVGVYASADPLSSRWHVCLFNAHGEQLQLFELVGEDVAVYAARQVAGFLSLPFALPSAAAIDTLQGAAVPPSAGPLPDEEPRSDLLWVYRGHFGLVLHGIGIVCLVLGLVLAVGLLSAANLGGSRWLVLLAAAAPLCLIGLWLFSGGPRALIDVDEHVIKLWRAWPLPPAIYELPAYSAVTVAPESAAVSDDEPPRYLIGLLGADHIRLEVVRDLPRDEALIAATELAAVARLTLIEEPLPAPLRSGHIT